MEANKNILWKQENKANRKRTQIAQNKMIKIGVLEHRNLDQT